ncbi:biosynthetic peptidoglycan transglycosylase [Anaerocolumna sp. AGMB13020]|uniref:biosynthetic peptidoglycan transglycosylase n=1 Tax=Anaerocolumna sp. AGMB13020 TaxID=3081750 RepID=UPI002954F1C5|nr:biosynthetic peptidoglycan transglycosylase [Anaerocolumna sp. AGMB13020]WOO37903.1 biosynthetic peptidoglycan transglycosylase [Anaerocolumna sp. AGMB13020]
MKKKKVRISILVLALIGLIAGIIKISPTVVTGYEMYKTAIKTMSISDKVEEIRQDENYITFDEIPEEYINQVLKSEDKRFYYHLGFDPISTTRAMANNIMAGRFVQGGSTITQQLAKNMYFSFEKNYERKVAELFVAFKLEKELTKDEILELYCNIAYYGEGCYGLKQAAEHYYGVDPLELSEVQIVALVWTLKSPNNYNPNAYKGA